ncbi:hypothetical protein JXB12_07020 [candidate division KSB1 bacterium]|nr:hypothetical protein [candidate division KSB1 bacterium]
MKELLYFSFSDLLIRVQYSKQTNSLKYSSHRSISFGERVVIEQYILSTVALKTDWYNQSPALFIYLGEDESLVKDLNLLHLKNTIKVLSDRDNEIKKEVNDLIANSMTNYYFEQIGDELLSLRQKLNESIDEELLSEWMGNIDELVKAYNQYSKKKIKVDDIIPIDIKKYLEIA